MPTSDLVAVAALFVSLLSASYARFAARETTRMNELSFRAEWLEAHDTMCKAQQRLTLPTGAFAKLTAAAKRGFPSPLDESLVHELERVSWRATLWADHRVHKCLSDTVMWNEQLEINLDVRSAQDGEISLERLTQLDREAVNYADQARKSIGVAIDIVRARLRASAP